MKETDTHDDSFNGDKILEDCSGQYHTQVKPTRKKGRPKGTPPKKAPNFIIPQKKSLFRKRKSTPDSWKKNIRKKTQIFRKGVHFCERGSYQGKNFKICRLYKVHL